MIDIREVLASNEFGEGVIDGGKKIEDPTQVVPVWEVYITIGKQQYVVSKCILQTEGWQPRKGDKVRFDRQPKGVDDTYLFASRVED